MKKTLLFYRKALFMKIALFAALILGGGNSAWADDAKTLPYEYGFEDITSSNSGLSTEGWTLVNCYNSSYSTSYTGTSPYVLSSEGYAGSNAFRFYPNSDYSAQCLISPEFTSSPSGIEVTFHYRSSSNSNPTQTFCVGYSTTNIDSFTWGDEKSYKSTTWETYNHIFPAGTKYIAIKYTNTASYAYLYLDGFEISVNDPYKTPTDFTLNSFTETSATFSWVAGNSETDWQFAYSTSSDFTPGTDGTTLDITTSDLSDGKYILTGLTEGTTYYAAIRADYGNGNYSEWTEKISFRPSNEVELTINEGTSTNGMGAVYGGQAAYLTYTQVIIPSSSLEELQNHQITKLTYYASQSSVTWGTATFEVYVKNTNSSAFPTSGYALENWGTNVFNEGTLSVVDGKMIINFNTPFNYTSGNLLIGFKQIKKGTSNTVSWYCSSTYTGGIGMYQYEKGSGRISYPPKVTITTVPVTNAYVKIGSTGYTTFSSAWPLDLSNLPSGLTAYYATASGVKADYVSLTPATTAVSAGTGLILKGTAGQTYAIPVADSGSDLDGNLMQGVPTLEETVATSDSKYVLVNNNGTPEFQNLSENAATIPGGKAYLDATGIAGARSLRIVFEDEMTGIRSMNSEPCTTNSAVFDLQGRRVTNGQLMKGLYIQNGKKMILK